MENPETSVQPEQEPSSQNLPSEPQLESEADLKLVPKPKKEPKPKKTPKAPKSPKPSKTTKSTKSAKNQTKSNKRAAEYDLEDDPEVLADLYAVRFIISRIIKKVQKGDAPPSISKSLTSDLYRQFDANQAVRVNVPEEEELERTESEILTFLEDNFERMSRHADHYKLKKKKLATYACRLRKGSVDQVFDYISDRPTVFRLIYVLIDKKKDEVAFFFKENKEVNVKNLKLLMNIKNIEFYKLKDLRELPKKIEQRMFKKTFVHSFLKKGYLYKNTLCENVKLLKEAAIRAQIKDVNFPKLDNETERHLGLLVKVEENARNPDQERQYMPIRNDELNTVHSRLKIGDFPQEELVIDENTPAFIAKQEETK